MRVLILQLPNTYPRQMLRGCACFRRSRSVLMLAILHICYDPSIQFWFYTIMFWLATLQVMKTQQATTATTTTTTTTPRTTTTTTTTATATARNNKKNKNNKNENKNNKNRSGTGTQTRTRTTMTCCYMSGHVCVAANWHRHPLRRWSSKGLNRFACTSDL